MKTVKKKPARTTKVRKVTKAAPKKKFGGGKFGGGGATRKY